MCINYDFIAYRQSHYMSKEQLLYKQKCVLEDICKLGDFLKPEDIPFLSANSLLC